jgi:hypothetical protein|tara:strand:- start:1561 stop:1698 length:138 start_codon:yes stop_codon:yes gene_type:complete
MAKKNNKKSNRTAFKKTYQGTGKWTKFPHNKRSKLYKKQYRGQGK